MKKDWNERARENALHYVVSGHQAWDEQQFFETGRINTEEQIAGDLRRICGGKLDPKQMVMLEIGCGVGRMTRYLTDIFGDVRAVDVSGEMIALARANLADRPNVKLYETNGVDLVPFPPKLFDFCFSFITFQHIPYRDAIVNYLREVHRTLKPARLFKFQVQGVKREEVDTWTGVGFSEQEMLDLADEIGFDVMDMKGQGTQYFWNWWVRR